MKDLYLVGEEVGIKEGTGEAIVVSRADLERGVIAQKMDLPLRHICQ